MLKWNREFTEAEKGLYSLLGLYPIAETDELIKYGVVYGGGLEMPSKIDKALFVSDEFVTFDKKYNEVIFSGKTNSTKLDFDHIDLIHKRMEELNFKREFT